MATMTLMHVVSTLELVALGCQGASAAGPSPSQGQGVRGALSRTLFPPPAGRGWGGQQREVSGRAAGGAGGTGEGAQAQLERQSQLVRQSQSQLLGHSMSDSSSTAMEEGGEDKEDW